MKRKFRDILAEADWKSIIQSQPERKENEEEDEFTFTDGDEEEDEDLPV